MSFPTVPIEQPELFKTVIQEPMERTNAIPEREPILIHEAMKDVPRET